MTRSYFLRLVILGSLTDAVRAFWTPRSSIWMAGGLNREDTTAVYLNAKDPSSWDKDEDLPPAMKEVAIDNIKAEMKLIAQLYKDDKAISKFKEHWFSERGPEMQKELMHYDFCIGKGPACWHEAEEGFLKLMKEDPSFLEVKARLSKLYCLCGRWEEATDLSLQVLAAKPWHFVALETMVAISTARGDTTMTELYKARRLPTPSQKTARQEWVDRALLDAEEILIRLKAS